MKGKEKIGDYMMDVSKYIITGFVLTAFFEAFAEKVWVIYVGGIAVSLFFFAIGVYMFNRK